MNLDHFQPSTLANEIRSKNFRSLAEEEHQFISIDYVLFPELYECGFKPFPRFDLQFSNKDRIIELIHLPKDVHCAIGFLMTQDELRAHFLINKYYKINRSNNDIGSFIRSQFDQLTTATLPDKVMEANGQMDVPTLYMKNHGKKLYNVKDCKEEMNQLSKSKDDFFDLISTFCNNSVILSDDVVINEEHNFINIEEFAKEKESMENQTAFILIEDTIPFFNIQPTHMKSNEKRSQTFFLHDDDDRKKPYSITISIACQGVFVDGKYEAAHLSASLKLINTNDTETYVGYAPYKLQFINTEQKLGHIVIKYDFDTKRSHIPTKYIFELDLIAQSTCQFSVDVTCLATFHANDVAIDQFCDFFIMCKRRRLEELHTMNRKLDQRIVKRKITMVENLIEEAEKRRKQFEVDVDSIELQMEVDIDRGRNYVVKLNQIKVRRSS